MTVDVACTGKTRTDTYLRSSLGLTAADSGR
jgi:hypothetical protein